MSLLNDIVIAIELHDVEGIRRCFERGLDPNDRYNNRPLFEELTSEYTRGPRFTACIKAFVEYGVKTDDSVLLSVWMNDAATLENLLQNNPDKMHNRYTLRCAYTPMDQVSLLHICAEFNLTACAEVLLRYGLDKDVRAGTDVHGFGGQTPVFHTVNQNGNHSAAMLDLLLEREVDLSITVPGLIWGKGYEWETFIPSVNPLSYAMMGMLPQMHRDEATTAGIISRLLLARYGIIYTPSNVPNRYLSH